MEIRSDIGEELSNHVAYVALLVGCFYKRKVDRTIDFSNKMSPKIWLPVIWTSTRRK